MSSISACLLDCPDCCSFLVNLSAETIQGNPEHPFTRGFICSKGKKFFQRLQDKNRITRPLLRASRGFEPISWDRALDLAAWQINRLSRRPEKILHVRGHGYRGVLAHASLNFFQALGSSTIYGSLCDGAGIEACIRDFGGLDHNDPLDLVNAHQVVNWGRDFTRSSPHLAAIIAEARKKGTRLLNITPGALSPPPGDDQIMIRPGTDRFLAAAVIRMLLQKGLADPQAAERTHQFSRFEKLLQFSSVESLLSVCQVSVKDAELVLDYYTRTGPAATLVGWGLQRHVFGGENVRFINALAMLAGHIGKKGAGAYFNISSGRSLGSWKAVSPRPDPGQRRKLPVFNLGQAMLQADPPVELVWVDGHNVINQAPDSRAVIRAFEKCFVICVEGFFNDTALRSDLILPPAFMLEKEEILGSCLHNYINYSGKIVDPRGECRSDFDILDDLGRRLDPPVEFPRAEKCLEQGLRLVNISPDELRQRGFCRAPLPQVAWEDLIFDHPDGLYRFPEALHPEPEQSPDFPLKLITHVRGRYLHSQIPEDEQQGLPTAFISQDSPMYSFLETGKKTYLATAQGRMEVMLTTGPGIHPSAVLVPRDGWIKCGHNPNLITASFQTDMGHNAAYYSQPCRLAQNS
ncbi:MAG: molybdopterin-dependent oxidoreductase [Desulfonatronovibrionaceae bacterium]